MFNIDPMSRQPIYEQIIRQLEQLVLRKLLLPGTQIPSVRSLSLELSINPNTIQKAYSELDSRGIIYSVPGRGCFISENAPALLGEHERSRLRQIGEMVRELALAGIGRDEVMHCIDDIYAQISISDRKDCEHD